MSLKALKNSDNKICVDTNGNILLVNAETPGPTPVDIENGYIKTYNSSVYCVAYDDNNNYLSDYYDSYDAISTIIAENRINASEFFLVPTGTISYYGSMMNSYQYFTVNDRSGLRPDPMDFVMWAEPFIKVSGSEHITEVYENDNSAILLNFDMIHVRENLGGYCYLNLPGVLQFEQSLPILRSDTEYYSVYMKLWGAFDSYWGGPNVGTVTTESAAYKFWQTQGYDLVNHSESLGLFFSYALYTTGIFLSLPNCKELYIYASAVEDAGVYIYLSENIESINNFNQDMNSRTLWNIWLNTSKDMNSIYLSFPSKCMLFVPPSIYNLYYSNGQAGNGISVTSWDFTQSMPFSIIE